MGRSGSDPTGCFDNRTDGREKAPALDGHTLQALTGGDPAEARALLDDFLDSTRVDLAELDRALADRDDAGLARQAHKIKGAARLVGAAALADAAAAL